MTKISEFQLFNVFGTVQVYKDRISAVATGILSDGHAVEHHITTTGTNLVPEVEGEAGVILFTAMLTEDKKTRVFTNNLSTRAGGPDLSKYEVVGQTIHKLVKEFWK